MNKKIIVTIIFLLLFLLLGVSVVSFSTTDVPPESQIDVATIPLHIGDVVLDVEIADTLSSRIQGLSGRTALSANTGLLFVFNKAGIHGFWMKDMLFPIDIIWINAEKKIVHIEENVLPSSYPKAFKPNEPALYVLEVSAGVSQLWNIQLGDAVKFSLVE